MLTAARRRARRGFTLAEVLVAVAVVAILAAVTIPTIRGRLQEAQEDTIVEEIDNLSSAVIAYHQSVGHYPPSLDYLSALPATAYDLCEINTLSTTAQAAWSGPYTSRAMSGLTGATYQIGSGASVEIGLTRATKILQTGTTAVDVLGILIDNVDSATARGVDYKIDGVLNNGAGQLWWVSSGNNTQLTYYIPIRKGAC
jgi:prepilin-type N-terminal cleavage/methylation domain-containing protein